MMMELKCAIVVFILVIRMDLKANNRCSVCSMNDGQFSLLLFVCVFQCGMGFSVCSDMPSAVMGPVSAVSMCLMV